MRNTCKGMEPIAHATSMDADFLQLPLMLLAFYIVASMLSEIRLENDSYFLYKQIGRIMSGHELFPCYFPCSRAYVPPLLVGVRCIK